MKKICYISTISYALKTFVLDSAMYLHDKGEYDITFICNDDDEFAKTLPQHIKYIPVSMKRGVSIHALSAIFRLIFIFKKEKFDIVQYSTPNASFYASIASKIAGIHVRLYCQWGLLYMGYTGFKKRIFRLIEKIICMLSTWIEPDSYGNLMYCQNEKFYNTSKSSVVWNGSASGVNLNKFNIDKKDSWRKEIRNKLDLSEDTFVIGFVGRITKDKGINELLSACSKLFQKNKKIALLMIGEFDNKENLDQSLLHWALQEERIIFVGKTNEVEKYLSSLDVFVLPSYREGFGSVIIEAEAMGVPVIVTNIPGPTEAMISNKTGIIVEKGNETSLLNAIDFIRQDNSLRIMMGQNGYQYAKDKFNQILLFSHILQDRNRLIDKQL